MREEEILNESNPHELLIFLKQPVDNSKKLLEVKIHFLKKFF